MKILHTVEFYHPSKGGSQEVVKQLSERMVELGHEVTVATSKLAERDFKEFNGVKIVEFDISGNAVRGYIGDTQRYKDFLLSNSFDVIMDYAAQQWATDLYLEVMDKIKARKVFVPCGFSGLHDPMYKDYFKAMPTLLKKFDATVYLSPTYRDTVFAKEHGVLNIHIIPNGADEREFGKKTLNVRKQLRVPSNSKLIMQLGSFTGQKGQPEAIKIFAGAKLKQATLVLVGNVFDRKLYKKCQAQAMLFNLKPSNIRAKRRVIVTQLDRPATVSLLEEADLFLFPSNIEASPLVLFEACAAKTPFMSTDVGNATEIAEWTKGGVIMPTAKDEIGNSHANIMQSAELLKDMLRDDKKLAELAKEGYKNWKANYSWDILARKYLVIYRGKTK